MGDAPPKYPAAMFDIVHELTVKASPDAVFEAVTTVGGLSSWFTSDCEVTATPETRVSLWFESHTIELVMEVDLVERPEAVHWNCVKGPEEWPGTKVAFRIEAAPAGSGGPGELGATGEGGETTVTESVVRLWHGNWEYEDGALPRCSFQWAMHLDSLRRYVETGTGTPSG